MKDDYMVMLSKKQVEQLVGLLDDYLEYGYDGYGAVRSTWDAIFHRMKVDDDSLPLYKVAYDGEHKKHFVLER